MVTVWSCGFVGERRRAPHAIGCVGERLFRARKHRMMRRRVLRSSRREHEQSGQLRGDLAEIFETRMHREDVRGGAIVWNGGQGVKVRGQSDTSAQRTTKRPRAERSALGPSIDRFGDSAISCWSIGQSDHQITKSPSVQI